MLSPSSNFTVRPRQSQPRPILDKALAVRPIIHPVRASHEMHSVCNQNETVLMRGECDLDAGGMEMNPISDNPKIGPGQTLRNTQNSKDPRVPVVQRPHRVEEMCDHGRASRHRGGRFFIRGFRVADGVDDASVRELWDQGHHVPALWGRSYHFDDGRSSGSVQRIQRGVDVGGAVHVLEIFEAACELDVFDLVDAVFGGV